MTGASQGVGEETARLLADRGAAGLVVGGRNKDRLDSLAESLRGSHCTVVPVRADLADVEQAGSVIDAAERAFGRADVVINCAGCTDRGTIASTTHELWDYVFAVNVRAPFFILQRGVELMRRHGTQGAVVNVISMTSYMGPPYLIAYAASKAALVNLTRTTAYALLPDRIRVNGLNIGWTDTPGEHETRRRWHGAVDDSWLERGAAAQPFGRLLRVGEVSRALAFLASPDSGIMTGSIVDFDQTILASGSLLDEPIVPPKAAAGV